MDNDTERLLEEVLEAQDVSADKGLIQALVEDHAETLQVIEGDIRLAVKQLDQPQAKTYPPVYYALVYLRQALKTIMEAQE